MTLIDFDATNLRPVIETMVRDGASIELCIVAAGVGGAFAEAIRLRVAAGRVIDARGPGTTGVRSLVRMFLGAPGTIERVEVHPPSGTLGAFPSVTEFCEMAETEARAVVAWLEPFGGSSARWHANLDRLSACLDRIAAPSSGILALVDGHRSIADVLARSEGSLARQAEAIARLAELGVLEPWGGSEDLARVSATSSETDADAPSVGPVELPTGWDTDDELGEERTSLGDERDHGGEGARGVFDSRTRRDLALAFLAAVLFVSSIAILEIRARERGASTPSDESLGREREAVTERPIVPVAPTSSTTLPRPFSRRARSPVVGPNAPEELRQAETLFDAGRYDEAGALLAELRAVRANDPAVWVLSGLVYVDTDRLHLAEMAAERALAIDPKHFRAHVLHGTALQFRWRLRGALFAYREAIRLAPTDPISIELASVVEDLERRVR